MIEKSEKDKTIGILLSMGSNIGDRRNSIFNAIEFLRLYGAIKDVRLSSFYETEPVGETDQDEFINIVLKANTSLSPFNLLAACKSVEYLVGRTKRERWREREIDIDILVYGDSEYKNEKIEIPHPRMHERNFVLIPANEIAPDLYVSKYGKTINELLEECSDNSLVKIIQ